jgi:hypothetical protein
VIGALAVIVSLVGAFLTRGVSGAQGFGAALVGGCSVRWLVDILRRSL